MGRILIYGAYGYTGKLIIEEALAIGLNPIVAGRNPGKTKALASEHGLDFRIFGLANKDEIINGLKGIDLVLNAAGPFVQTAKPMVEACLASKTHYLDITGEIPVFDWVSKHHEAALKSGICLMPGAGFDIVPTDCMAKRLHKAMPDATHLELAFASLGGGVSHGTMLTMVENLGNSGAIRENGKIVNNPIGSKGKYIDFGLKKLFCMSIPWGDVVTSFYTTGILNITVFTAASKSTFRFLKLQGLFNPILRTKWVKNTIKKYINKKITGPSRESNKNGISLIWGEVSNSQGKKHSLRLQTREGYLLTAKMSVLLIKKVLEKGPVGFHTPAACFGSDLILEIEGSSFLEQ
ncbi:saccharopine dehydrogenase family protein [Pararhodonellum marinum]|uniref:saccharopine dehydrogenase family protein n=1 Tax=Pararhodonellum marinum TaxID=2755358 RepID=UPI00188FA271|nr:saccharopine dehydrogenase NADP-binding domain-containing protein [Pararhodonellum marinum]